MRDKDWLWLGHPMAFRSFSERGGWRSTDFLGGFWKLCCVLGGRAAVQRYGDMIKPQCHLGYLGSLSCGTVRASCLMLM